MDDLLQRLRVGTELNLTGTVRTVEALHPDGHVRITLDLDTAAAPITFVSPSTAIERGEEGTARAARRWTPEESARVDEAIRTVARDATNLGGRTANLGVGEFTTAEVWAELGEGFPVTKGIAAKMTAAKRDGVIENTGRTTYNDHPRHDHAHGQRLTVWRAR